MQPFDGERTGTANIVTDATAHVIPSRLADITSGAAYVKAMTTAFMKTLHPKRHMSRKINLYNKG